MPYVRSSFSTRVRYPAPVPKPPETTRLFPRIEQAAAARAFVSLGRASMLPASQRVKRASKMSASQRVKKNKVNNETGTVQAVAAWASVCLLC
jgi:hypothetical protein